MARFLPTCRQCFQETGQTILLKEDGGRLTCPNNPNHQLKNDVMIA